MAALQQKLENRIMSDALTKLRLNDNLTELFTNEFRKFENENILSSKFTTEEMKICRNEVTKTVKFYLDFSYSSKTSQKMIEEISGNVYLQRKKECQEYYDNHKKDFIFKLYTKSIINEMFAISSKIQINNEELKNIIPQKNSLEQPNK